MLSFAEADAPIGHCQNVCNQHRPLFGAKPSEMHRQNRPIVPKRVIRKCGLAAGISLQIWTPDRDDVEGGHHYGASFEFSLLAIGADDE